jgi:hypothetical protein
MDGSKLSILPAGSQPARIAGLWIILFALMSAIGGCATIVRPPSQPQQPTTIYLTDEFIHSSVVLPMDDGRYVEYAFGDWTYAALNRHDPYHVVQALFFSPQGALGRRYLNLDPKSHDLAPQLKGITVNQIVVDREQVRALEHTLEARFVSNRPQAENPDNHFIWVTVDDPYALWSNCNTLTKSNLRHLGCEVDSRSVFAMYEVKTPTMMSSSPVYASTAARRNRSTIGCGKMR